MGSSIQVDDMVNDSMSAEKAILACPTLEVSKIRQSLAHFLKHISLTRKRKQVIAGSLVHP